MSASGICGIVGRATRLGKNPGTRLKMKYKTVFRLILKATGVFLFFSGVSTAVMYLAFTVMYFIPGMSGSIGPWPYFMMQFLAPLLQIVAGAYLFFGGKWIADLAIPSNRPYCHECGYELTGAVGHVCTECGTPFKAPEP
jgi:hypothetical protein